MRDLPPIHLYVLAVILVHSLGQFAYMGVWRHLTAPDFDVNDFKAYYTAGLALRTGQGETLLYSDPERLNLGLLPPQPWVDFAVGAGIPHPSAYIYPPFFALLVAPLTLLPYHAANLTWFAINLLLLAASACVLVSLCRDRDTEGRAQALAAAAVLFVCLNFFPTLRAMQCGQAGFVLLFLTAAALWCALRRRDVLAGLCLALASAVKLTPVILILYLAWAGRRRAAAWGGMLLAGFTLVSIAVAGWGNHVLYFSEFLPRLSQGAATYANQSFNGFLNRLLTDQSMAVFDFSREPASVWLLTRLAAVAALAAAFLVARPPRAMSGPESTEVRSSRLALGYGLVVLTSVLVSPISWEHHYVLALIPLALMIREAAAAPRLGGTLALAGAYSAMATDAFEVVRKQLPRGSRPAMSYVMYGAIALWVLMAVTLRRKRRVA